MSTPDADHGRPVTAPDGTRLMAFASGPPTRPAVLLIHGYPDTHRVWDVVIDALQPDFRVLTYDVRGAGASHRPDATRAYRVTTLAADARAVARALAPGQRVHLVGHDWGSVTGWEVVSAPEAASWVASYTTISGPGLDHVGHWIRTRLRAPSAGRLRPVLQQQLKSWYLPVFAVPGLAETAWRAGLASRWERRLRRTEGMSPEHCVPAPTLPLDATAGLRMYRANLWSRLHRRPEPRPAAVGVQFLVPLRDRYVSPALAAAGLDWAVPAWWRPLDTGHWGAVRTHGGLVARAIAELAKYCDDGAEAPDLAAARVH